MRLTSPVALLAVATALAAGCSGGSDSGADQKVRPARTGENAGRIYSVGQAARQRPRGLVAIRGYLVSPSGRPIRFCSRLTGSHPPECAGPSLRADDAEVETMAGLERAADGSAWSPQPIRLVGRVDGDRLLIEEIHR